MNLLSETTQAMQRWAVTIDEIEWIGSSDGAYAINWEKFAALANFTYDSGWGSQEVARDLVIVGTDWWMSRYEYDGSEGWEFHRKPTRIAETRLFTSVNCKAAGCTGYGCIEDVEEEMEEQRNNPTGWNAVFHSHPITNNGVTA